MSAPRFHVWTAKVVVLADELELRPGADFPMRQAVRLAVQGLQPVPAGAAPVSPVAIFSGWDSGWGGALTDSELEVVEADIARARGPR